MMRIFRSSRKKILLFLLPCVNRFHEFRLLFKNNKITMLRLHFHILMTGKKSERKYCLKNLDNPEPEKNHPKDITISYWCDPDAKIP